MVGIVSSKLRFSFFISFICVFAAVMPTAADTNVVRPGDLDHFVLTVPESAVTEVPQEPVEGALDSVEEPPSGPGPVQEARMTLQGLTQVSLVESRGQAMVTLETSGPVSFNASTGSALSKDWIFIELFPVQQRQDTVPDVVEVESELIGEIHVEELEAEKVKVSLHVLPPAISYVVSQQDRAVVVKIIKNK